MICHLNEKLAPEAEPKHFQNQLKMLCDKIPNLTEFLRDVGCVKLIRDGQLWKLSRKSKQIRYIILFDTHIVIAKPYQVFNDMFTLTYSFALKDISAYVKDRDSLTFVLSVPLPHKSSVFKTNSIQQCKDWVTDIMEKRRIMLSTENEYEGDQLTLPEWEPDSDCTNCTACARRFSLTNRKHHCRLCGLVYCESCSRQRWPISGAPVRVCDICFAIKTIDECPSLSIPVKVLQRIGGCRSSWDKKSHLEKWYTYKDEFFYCHNEDDEYSTSYLREIIAASPNADKSGHLLLWDFKLGKFIPRWVVIEQSCLLIFEARKNTIALGRYFLSNFCFEGPTPASETPFVRGNNESSVSARFVFKVYHENYNNIGNETHNSPLTKSRKSSSSFLHRVFSSQSFSSTETFFVFGTEEECIADDWLQVFKKVKRLSQLTNPSSTSSS